MVNLRLLFTRKNLKHIAKHQIGRDEIEEVCYDDPLIQKARKGRIAVIGLTESGRIIKIILESKGSDKYYMVTAYEADAEEIAVFKRLKGVS